PYVPDREYPADRGEPSGVRLSTLSASASGRFAGAAVWLGSPARGTGSGASRRAIGSGHRAAGDQHVSAWPLSAHSREHSVPERPEHPGADQPRRRGLVGAYRRLPAGDAFSLGTAPEPPPIRFLGRERLSPRGPRTCDVFEQPVGDFAGRPRAAQVARRLL